MTENEPDIPELTGTPLGTTGKELREAREAKGWDISTLSESLHLRPAVLIAIEEGSYREVPELFLKGYVRSYARLVGLEGDRLIRQVESELEPLRQEEAENRVESPTFHIAVKKQKKRRVAFWMLLFAFFIVILFGLIRFQNLGYDLGFSPSAERGQEQIDNPAEAGQPEPSLPDLEDVTETAPRNIEIVGDDESLASVPASGSDPGRSVLSEQGPQALPEFQGPESDDSANSGASVEDAPAEAESRPAPVETLAERSENAEEPAPVDPEEAFESIQTEVSDSAQEATGPAQNAERVSFSLQFKADCWVEIRDATGERIFAGLMTPGDQLSRAAVAPVSFVIGNVGAIESFSFDGQPVRVGEYPSRNDRAEITLGKKSGN